MLQILKNGILSTFLLIDNSIYLIKYFLGFNNIIALLNFGNTSKLKQIYLTPLFKDSSICMGSALSDTYRYKLKSIFKQLILDNVLETLAATTRIEEVVSSRNLYNFYVQLILRSKKTVYQFTELNFSSTIKHKI